MTTVSQAAPTVSRKKNGTETVQKEIRVGPGETTFTVVFLVLWIVLFLAGILINSRPYREAFTNMSEMSLAVAISSGLVVLFAYTISNVAFLSILAGLLGTAARRSQLGTDEEKIEGRDTKSPYLSAVLRGFMVYLVVISGTLVIIDQPFTADRVTQEQYVRLAGVLSLVSFSVNLDPRQVAGLVDRVRNLLRRGEGTEKAGQQQSGQGE